MQAEVKGGAEKFRFLRPRTIYYGAVMALVGAIMLYALVFRSPLELHVLHDRNPVFTTLSSGEIRNGYTIKILNKTHDFQTYSLSVEGIENASIAVKAAGEISADALSVPADSVGSYHVLVSASVEPSEPRKIRFTLQALDVDMKDSYDSKFISRRD